VAQRELPTDTAPPERPLRRLQRARLGRRIIITALVLFLLAAALGAFGVRTRTVTSAGGGFELTVEYATVTRPGLATPWSVEVRRPGGFDDPIVIAVSSEYLDMFDENGLDPDPSKATSYPGYVEWSFEPPSTDTLSVAFDARLEPARQWGRPGTVQVINNGRPVTEVVFRTWVMP
jgi:hypothetical protein